eukprot:TRINITY_DN1093_c0_g3_i1.p2 TRINITY_DN1093_c0_g3~~TRINITY_DN1093_c0_g3_i1.p2  ORF type:complete len:176 (+),score=43.18 TRINITY_DN1093_c0_g3_i1:772-1299(+)
MDLQAEADRKRRKNVLESEGDRDAMTNRAAGEQKAKELLAEAERVVTVKQAEGEASKMKLISEAQADAIRIVATTIKNNANSEEAMKLEVAKKYIESFGNIAKETNTVVLPSNLQDPSAMITSAMSVYAAVNKGTPISPSPLPFTADAGEKEPEAPGAATQAWTPEMPFPPPPLQ